MCVMFVFYFGNFKNIITIYLWQKNTALRQHGRLHIVAILHGNTVKTFNLNIEWQKYGGKKRQNGLSP